MHPSCEVTRTEPCPAQLSLPGPIPLCTGRAWGTGLSPRLRLGDLGGTAREAGPGAGTIPPGQAGLGPPVQVLERGGEWGAGGCVSQDSHPYPRPLGLSRLPIPCVCFIEGNGTLSVFSPGRNPSRGGESPARPNYLLPLRERRVMKSRQSLPRPPTQRLSS